MNDLGGVYDDDDGVGGHHDDGDDDCDHDYDGDYYDDDVDDIGHGAFGDDDDDDCAVGRWLPRIAVGTRGPVGHSTVCRLQLEPVRRRRDRTQTDR